MKDRKLLRPQLFRTISSRRALFAAQETTYVKPVSHKATTVPSVKGPPNSKLDTETAPVTATQSIASGIRKAAPKFTETYVAYGVCEELVKECARVADYTIPQAKDPKAEIPRNDKGEDIGIATGWWYNCKV